MEDREAVWEMGAEADTRTGLDLVTSLLETEAASPGPPWPLSL